MGLLLDCWLDCCWLPEDEWDRLLYWLSRDWETAKVFWGNNLDFFLSIYKGQTQLNSVLVLNMIEGVNNLKPVMDYLSMP